MISKRFDFLKIIRILTLSLKKTHHVTCSIRLHHHLHLLPFSPSFPPSPFLLSPVSSCVSLRLSSVTLVFILLSPSLRLSQGWRWTEGNSWVKPGWSVLLFPLLLFFLFFFFTSFSLFSPLTPPPPHTSCCIVKVHPHFPCGAFLLHVTKCATLVRSGLHFQFHRRIEPEMCHRSSRWWSEDMKPDTTFKIKQKEMFQMCKNFSRIGLCWTVERLHSYSHNDITLLLVR